MSGPQAGPLSFKGFEDGGSPPTGRIVWCRRACTLLGPLIGRRRPPSCLAPNRFQPTSKDGVLFLAKSHKCVRSGVALSVRSNLTFPPLVAYGPPLCDLNATGDGRPVSVPGPRLLAAVACVRRGDAHIRRNPRQRHSARRRAPDRVGRYGPYTASRQSRGPQRRSGGPRARGLAA